MAEYGAGLDDRRQAVVLNKTDLLTNPPALDNDDDRIAGVFAVSAATGAGIEEFKRRLFELCPPASPPAADPDALADFLVYRPQPQVPAFRILRTDRGFRVHGRPPSDKELTNAQKFLEDYGRKQTRRSAWAALCQALFASAEFAHR